MNILNFEKSFISKEVWPIISNLGLLSVFLLLHKLCIQICTEPNVHETFYEWGKYILLYFMILTCMYVQDILMELLLVQNNEIR